MKKNPTSELEFFFVCHSNRVGYLGNMVLFGWFTASIISEYDLVQIWVPPGGQTRVSCKLKQARPTDCLIPLIMWNQANSLAVRLAFVYIGLALWEQLVLTFPCQTALFVDFLQKGFVFLILLATSIITFQTNSRISIY